MKYIETLREGENVREIYLCKYKTSAMTKNGKPYETLILQDKTGVADAKIWDPASGGIGDFEALDYIEITGKVIMFNGSIQINIERARKAYPDEYVPADYLPVTDKNIEEMYDGILSLVKSVKNPYLGRLLNAFFVDDQEFAAAFKSHSAAKSVHHAFVGGLLQHTLAVAKLCDFYTAQYPVLNRDLLICAALCHDIGKIGELSDFPMNDYTDEGQLVGHIVMGCGMVSKKIDEISGFPAKLANELKHCILAHHGELVYGSPKKPALIEALALNFADNTDAKMESMQELLAGGASKGDAWLGYSKLFESNVRRTGKQAD